MAYLLCHECWTWGEPCRQSCPHCGHLLDPAEPDPPVQQLQALLGELVARLGEVHVRRKALPQHTTLYATTTGLFFLPHRQEWDVRPVEDFTAATSLLLTLAAIIWSPVALLRPFMGGSRSKPQRVLIRRPRFLDLDDSDLLVELLMNDPGSFFIPRRTIQLVQRKRRYWVIQRHPGSDTIFEPLGHWVRFAEKLKDLAQHSSWGDVLIEA